MHEKWRDLDPNAKHRTPRKSMVAPHETLHVSTGLLPDDLLEALEKTREDPSRLKRRPLETFAEEAFAANPALFENDMKAADEELVNDWFPKDEYEMVRLETFAEALGADVVIPVTSAADALVLYGQRQIKIRELADGVESTSEGRERVERILAEIGPDLTTYRGQTIEEARRFIDETRRLDANPEMLASAPVEGKGGAVLVDWKALNADQRGHGPMSDEDGVPIPDFSFGRKPNGKPVKVHLKATPFKVQQGEDTACSVYTAWETSIKVVTNVRLVTCGNCKKTTWYKQKLAKAEARDAAKKND